MKSYRYRSCYNLIITLAMMLPLYVYATHNRAGEITYEQIDDLTIRATITTYTRTSSFAADRDSLVLYWGDGTSEGVQRANGYGTELPNDVKVNYYIAEHTYPTRSTYKLSITDPNRIAGIQNIDFPNSVNIQFYIETTLTLLDTRFQGRNSSAVLLQAPIDYACVGQIFTHNPNAYDPDGDSLAYELIVPFSAEGIQVPNYNFPDEIAPGIDNTISLDPTTGEFVWQNPPVLGDFNITFLIKEYREGILINQIIRDMQILVRACQENNVPPDIDVPAEICVIAGEHIEIPIIATDRDTGQTLNLTVSGGPLSQTSNPAVFESQSIPDSSYAKGLFSWQTSCEHISEEYYQLVVRVSDDFFGFESGLATLRDIRIKVVGPPPEDVEAEKLTSDLVHISWAAPYDCDTAENFKGFSVWRRNQKTSVTIDSCQGGLSGNGYEEIVFLTTEQENGRYFVIDQEVENSDVYCYRILGEFAQETDDGYLYNRTESLPSDETCVRYDRNKPLMTKASVLHTNVTDGEVLIAWLPPIPDAIDTTTASAPFSYDLRRDGMRIGHFEAGSFEELKKIDQYSDTKINTVDSQYHYTVSFANIHSELVESSIAGTIMAKAVGRDRSITLTWDEEVPWVNERYRIYEILDGESILLDSTTNQSYTVEGLENEAEHCFKIQSIGYYGIEEVDEPLLNFSQEVCAAPLDSVAPCVPHFTVNTLCEKSSIDHQTELFNTITWTFTSECEKTDDFAGFGIYYQEDESADYQKIDEVGGDELSYKHLLDDNIAGCYRLSAFDSRGNESATSEEFCVDNCPDYILPNTFTPNGDGSNDRFTPSVNRFIDFVEFEVFNRWGQLVYRTEDANLDWDGTNLQGKDLDTGTYYYTCKVFEKRVDGIRERDQILNGWIQLIRS